MAMLACDQHWRDDIQANFGDKWVAGVDPFDFPDTAAICFKPGCKNPATVYLEQHEYEALKRKPPQLYFIIEGGYGQVRIG
jgi:hypothetical protein